MKELITYKSFDGKYFEDKVSCELYERDKLAPKMITEYIEFKVNAPFDLYGKILIHNEKEFETIINYMISENEYRELVNRISRYEINKSRKFDFNIKSLKFPMYLYKYRWDCDSFFTSDFLIEQSQNYVQSIINSDNELN